MESLEGTTTYKSMKKRLELICSGGQVKRFHGIPTIRTETVAEHSYMVAWLARFLSQHEFPSAELLLQCLQHDVPEAVLGDIPGPTKSSIGSSFGFDFDTFEKKVLRDHGERVYADSLKEGEHRIVLLSDIAAGRLFCVQERMMGNKLIVKAYDNYTRVYLKMIEGSPSVAEMTLGQIIDSKWREANE